MNRDSLIKEIKSVAVNAGISSSVVTLAKDVVENKCKDHSLFVCEGLWAVDKLIQKSFKVKCFYVCENCFKENFDIHELEKIAKMAKYSEKTYIISEKTCKKISDRDGYDEYFIIAEQPKLSLESIEKLLAKKSEALCIVMDGLEQPGNIGAILRSFDAAGGDFAIITNRRARLTNSRIVRSSLGASFMLPVVETDIDDAQKWLVKNHFRCLVTDLKATKSFKDADYSGKVAIIAGNEHTGISDSWRSVQGAESIIIPMLGSCESLNVGFASTLVAYEAGLKKFGTKK